MKFQWVKCDYDCSSTWVTTHALTFKTQNTHSLQAYFDHFHDRKSQGSQSGVCRKSLRPYFSLENASAERQHTSLAAPNPPRKERWSDPRGNKNTYLQTHNTHFSGNHTGAHPVVVLKWFSTLIELLFVCFYLLYQLGNGGWTLEAEHVRGVYHGPGSLRLVIMFLVL